jgi:ABC-type antimicrobial peptide transport system permease subunit
MRLLQVLDFGFLSPFVIRHLSFPHVTTGTFIWRSLRFHARSHLGAFFGAAVGSAVLIGALVVGDSVRLTLRDRALERLGRTQLALFSGDRFFTQTLGRRLGSPLGFNSPATSTQTVSPDAVFLRAKDAATTLLQLPGTATREDDSARANRVQVFGVQDSFWSFGQSLDQRTSPPSGAVLLNEALAAQLRAKAGDTVVLRLHKPSALSRDAVITPRDDTSVALRLTVQGVVGGPELGSLNLATTQTPPFNAFVRLEDLALAAGAPGHANLLLAGPAERLAEVSRVQTVQQWLARQLGRFGSRRQTGVRLAEGARTEQELELYTGALDGAFRLEDAELSVRALTNAPFVELASRRIFLDKPICEAALAANRINAPSPSGRTNPKFATISRAELRKAIEAGLLPVDLAKAAETGDPSEILAQLPASVVAKAFGEKGVTGASQTGASFAAGDLTNGIGILSYLVNQFGAGDRTTPYSVVAAAGPPYTTADMGDDEILVNQWLAEDLRVRAGDGVELTYFLADSGSALVERTTRFRIRAIVPIEGLYADRTLMPDFPGLAKAESTHDWDAGFPLVHKIRDQDEAYWKQYRGTPKAFITLSAGQKMWANRFGDLTSIRWRVPDRTPPMEFQRAIYDRLLERLQPETVGLHFEPVRAQALAAANQSQDFGELFLGFSFFLIGAALLLMALLFQFGIEQRATEIGTLLALGFTPKQVRRLLLLEGGGLALAGGIIGVVGGIGYARAMLLGLSTIWRGAVQNTALQYHVEPQTLAFGAVGAVVVVWLTVWLALRKQARQPARELLAEGTVEKHQTPNIKDQNWNRARLLAVVTGLSAVALVGWAIGHGATSDAETFFSAGALLLIAGIAFSAAVISSFEAGRDGAPAKFNLSEMGVRNCARRRTRSLATIGLLACGSFLIASIGVFRLDAVKDAEKRASGTGGFALIGESTLPIVQDLNRRSGREFFGLDDSALAEVAFVPFRVREGDEASCLNLNRAQKPRLLGVRPELLADRKAFTFAKIIRDIAPKNPWFLIDPFLHSEVGVAGSMKTPSIIDDTVPAIGDEASIVWAMGKKVGDTLDYTDERGRTFKVRIVAAVANSILQGNLVIAEDALIARFPSESGYRMFLIDAPSKNVNAISETLSRSLRDTGLELTPTTRRLAAFNAVQNTYLSTFQVLGGLGLLLGSVGLGVVVMRNVLERRSELALLLAVGFRRRALKWLVVSEHGALLLIGLAVGIVAAGVAVLPALLSPGPGVPYVSLALTLGAVFLNGIIWTFVAAALALRGRLLDALRNE